MAHGNCSLAPTDPLLKLHYHKTLELKLAGQVAQFAVPTSVFSTFQIDRGTQRLLRTVAAGAPRWGRVLDVGCGYGAIAVSLAKAGLARHVDAIEPDALALAFAAHNAKANALTNVTVCGGVAYDNLPADGYDAIITNLPAKAGPSVHEAILLGASGHLRPGGVVWLVAVEPLAGFVDGLLDNDAIDVRTRVAFKGHVVYAYAFAGVATGPAHPYLRGREQFSWRGRSYRLDCLHGLGDFDNRSWTADAVIDLFAQIARVRPPETIAVCNPSQGHLAVLAAAVADGIREVTVMARDYLALLATRNNLRANGYQGDLTCVHTPALHVAPARPAVVLALLREKEGMAVNIEKIRQLFEHNGQCAALVGCKAQFGGKLADSLGRHGVSVRAKRRVKGAVALHLQRRGGPDA